MKANLSVVDSPAEAGEMVNVSSAPANSSRPPGVGLRMAASLGAFRKAMMALVLVLFRQPPAVVNSTPPRIL